MNRKNLLLFVSSLILSLLFLELLLRLFFPEGKKPESPRSGWALAPERVWTEYHPILGWHHQKSKTALLRVGERETLLHTNSLGFRGQREYSLVKPEGARRVLVLGDSFVFGFGVQDEETFSAVLEQQNPTLEVINAGVPGYGIDQIYLSFSTLGSPLKPDCVLIGIFPEDFWRATRAFTDTGHAKPYFSLSPDGRLIQHNVPVPPPFTLKTGQYPQIIDRGPVQNFLQQSAVYRGLRRAVIKIEKKLALTDWNSEDEWILGREILKRLIQDVRKTGAQPLVVIIPPERWITNDQWDSLHQSLLDFFQREKLNSLDLTPEFLKAARAHGVSRYYIEHNGHWTAEGHRFVAGLIADFFKQNGFTG